MRGVGPLLAATVVAVLGFVVLAATLIALGALLIHVLLPGPLQRWDDRVVQWFAERRTPSLNDLSVLGSWIAEVIPVIAIGSALAVLLAAKRKWLPLGVVVFGLVTEVAVYMTVTSVIRRQRPPVRFLEELRPDASFPSGHTAAAVVLYFAIAAVVTTFSTNRAWRRVAWIVAAVVPLVVASARLYRGMHHPSDVAAGYLMGVGCILVSLLAVRVGQAVASAPEAQDDRG